MSRHSAGILLYRRSTLKVGIGFLKPYPSPQPAFEFLLVHPGGPFWQNKDMQAWSIPKGEIGEIGKTGEFEEAEEAARREFAEEMGRSFDGRLTPLPLVKTSGGKIIHAFLGEGDFDTSQLKSNLFDIEWPPKSGRMQSFPEVDKAAWFDVVTAKVKIHKGQVAILESAMLYHRLE